MIKKKALMLPVQVLGKDRQTAACTFLKENNNCTADVQYIVCDHCLAKVWPSCYYSFS